MEQNKLSRLNFLFEKAVENNAKVIEKQELNELYNEFINDGRDEKRSNTIIFPWKVQRSVG